MNRSRPGTPGTPGSNIGPMGERLQPDYFQRNKAGTPTPGTPQAEHTEQPASGATTSGTTSGTDSGRATPAPQQPQALGEKWAPGRSQRPDGKVELTEADAWEELGYCFPTWKKWTILTVIFVVQTSMNFNTSLYSNGLAGISEKFHVSEQAARVGAAIFLITYAFGCELWAPWSEGKFIPFCDVIYS